MTNNIEPALTPDEWKEGEIWIRHESRQPKRGLWLSFSADGLVLREHGQWKFQISAEDLPKLIAASNAALRYGDKRKLARADAAELRATVAKDPVGVDDRGRDVADSPLVRIAQVLESYFPPELQSGEAG